MEEQDRVNFIKGSLFVNFAKHLNNLFILVSLSCVSLISNYMDAYCVLGKS